MRNYAAAWLLVTGSALFTEVASAATANQCEGKVAKAVCMKGALDAASQVTLKSGYKDDHNPFGSPYFVTAKASADDVGLSRAASKVTYPGATDVAASDGYTISYNAANAQPNWVSYRLRSSDFVETVPRYGDAFVVDPWLDANKKALGITKLPAHDTYTNTGYDRGHMLASEHRTQSDYGNFTSFVTSNLIPQSSPVNSGPWAEFEDYCKTLATSGKRDLFVIAGPLFESSTVTYVAAMNKLGVESTTILRRPDAAWKIVVSVPAGTNVSTATSSVGWEIFALIMANRDENGCYPLSDHCALAAFASKASCTKVCDATLAIPQSTDWNVVPGLKTTLTSLETKTGLKFFSLMSSALRAEVESKVNTTIK